MKNNPHINFWRFFPQPKATERDRTADLLITNQLLYRLSYGGLFLDSYRHQFN